MDMNDRQLRFIVDGLGGKVNGTPREDGFDITVASEVMADLLPGHQHLRPEGAAGQDRRAPTPTTGKPVTAGEIGAAGAMTALLKDALDPNLVQTLENNPAIIHGGPFANIAHGCNSVMATKLSLSAGRLRHHRGRFRCRPGRGEVPGHQVPLCGHRTQRLWCWWRPSAPSRATAALPRLT